MTRREFITQFNCRALSVPVFGPHRRSLSSKEPESSPAVRQHRQLAATLHIPQPH